MRGYITGTTSTFLWTQYQKGVRKYCGIEFPEGLSKNQKLDEPVLTPTTKETEHDRPISPAEIVSEGWNDSIRVGCKPVLPRYDYLNMA